jgi:hypothetical protein
VGRIVGTRQGPLVQLDQPVPGQIRLGPVKLAGIGETQAIAQDPGPRIEVGVLAHRR